MTEKYDIPEWLIGHDDSPEPEEKTKDTDRFWSSILALIISFLIMAAAHWFYLLVKS